MAGPPSNSLKLGAALAILALGIAGVASTALAGAANAKRQQTIDRTVRFLQESQRPSGGFANPGKKPAQGISAWVALALAAAGVNPQDQATCGTDAFTFLETHFAESFREEAAWPATATTAFERELLVVDAAGTDPHDFAGYDLVAQILARQLPDGSFPYVPGGRGEINDTAFAVLALSPVDEPAAQAAARRGAEWLETQPNADGAWSWQVKGTADNVDLTGGVLEALNAAGDRGSGAQRDALAYLRAVQRPDGGFSETGPGESNVASTSWAVQGLWAAGEDPETWLTHSGEATEEPLDYMESLQQPDGHVRWKKSSDMNGIWMTAYVTPAFAGQALPIARVPRALPSAAAASAVPASCAEPKPGEGSAGGEEKEGEGVIAGGGGEGAPLFSRPKPQSRGKTAGGARLVGKHPHSRDHSRTRRGVNQEQPSGTESAEPDREGDGEAQPAVVGGGDGGDGGGRGAASGAHRAGSAGAGPEGVALAAERSRAGAGGAGSREVTGAVIGSGADGGEGLAFGAPGLRSAAAGGGGDGTGLAIAIGLLALVGAAAGAQWERRRGAVLP